MAAKASLCEWAFLSVYWIEILYEKVWIGLEVYDRAVSKTIKSFEDGALGEG